MATADADHFPFAWAEADFWVDGAYSPVTRRVGVGIWFHIKGSFDHYSACFCHQVPDDWPERFCCETLAVWVSLQFIRGHPQLIPADGRINIFTDNLGLANGLISGRPPRRIKALWASLKQHQAAVESLGFQLRFNWERRTETGMWFADDWAKHALHRRQPKPLAFPVPA